LNLKNLKNIGKLNNVNSNDEIIIENDFYEKDNINNDYSSPNIYKESKPIDKSNKSKYIEISVNPLQTKNLKVINNSKINKNNVQIQINNLNKFANNIIKINELPLINYSSSQLRKIKQIDTILNQKIVNISELRSIAWKGLPYGKIIII